VTLEGADVEQVVLATSRDKKRVGQALPFVLVREPGEAQIGCEVGPSELRAAVAELAQR
jgi:3-dehydroquinate synthetase